ncbi:MAG: ABC transporter substrate-binding protein [Bacillota bacterium]|nr:ABC transporter substrate-binding protein [Bacillota bacterium]MDW7682567.1 ABC transporter substrate-binding protein [Bacillota bacterium]
MRRVFIIFAALLLVVTCTGCRKETVEQKERALHVASPANPITLNPLFLRDAVSAEAAALLHPQLLMTDPETLEPKPRLFSSWEVKEDNLTYVFTMHEEVYWSDGTAMTAEDVAFTMRAIIHPDYTGWMYPLLQHIKGAKEYRKNHVSPHADGKVTGITVVDERTLQVRLEKPHAPFLTYLVFAPLPAHILADIHVSELEQHVYSRTVPVGAGPYLFGEWRQDEYLYVRANPDYFLGKPEIEEIYYRVIPNPETQLIELLAGKLDLIPTAVKVEDIATLQNDPQVRIHRNPRLVYDYIGFNPARDGSPLANKKVRRALSLLLDKDGVVENLLLGFAEPLDGPVLPLHYTFDEEFLIYEENLPAARSLLLSAGYSRITLKLIVNAGNIVRENTALLFKEQAAKIGVDVNVTLLEWEAFLAAFREGDYDLVALGRGADADPDLTFHWHTDSPGNMINYSNEKVDQLLDEGTAVFDPARRTEIYREAQEIIVKDAPMIWLYTRQAVHAATADLEGFVPHPELLFYNVHQWHFSREGAEN